MTIDFRQFDTDKVHYHGYYPVYAEIAEQMGPAARVCELGVLGGESLRMWQALFPAGEVVGVDVSPGACWPNGTVKVVSAQDNPELPGMLGGEFDLIVDDASHDGGLTRKSFDLLWPLVAPGGYYVVEDWTVALRDDPHWGHCWGDGMLRTAESFLPMLAYRDGDCDEIRYRYGLVIIHKAASLRATSMPRRSRASSQRRHLKSAPYTDRTVPSGNLPYAWLMNV